MEIWLSQNKHNLRLPVLPASVAIGNPQQNTSVNITNLGEVNMLGKRGLKTISLSSLFPSIAYDFVAYKDFPNPMECVKRISSWMENPVQLIITGTDINMPMTIESFQYSKQGFSEDINFTLELKEYRRPKMTIRAKKAKVGKTDIRIAKPQTIRETKKVETIVYTVKKGDTLCAIAKRFTGDSSNYKAIANQNHISNPDRIEIGQKLVIKV